MRQWLWCITACLVVSLTAHAQSTETDTLVSQRPAAPILIPAEGDITPTLLVSKKEAQAVTSLPKPKFTPKPQRALWLALLLPGAGQIYNRKYWKIPIVYGGFVGCIYAWRWNGQMYKDYQQAYQDLVDDDPNTKSYEQFLHLGQQISDANKATWEKLFKGRKDRYRRWRDLSVFCVLGVYALSIIDAYVDASLSAFDISDDLSMKVTPAYINSRGGMMTASSASSLANGGLGVRCQLNF